MAPIRGKIVDTRGGLTVRLSTKAVVHVAKQQGLRLGDTCYILYDYTNSRVRSVWTEDEYNRSDYEVEPVDEEEELDELDANTVALMSLGLSVVSL